MLPVLYSRPSIVSFKASYLISNFLDVSRSVSVFLSFVSLFICLSLSASVCLSLVSRSLSLSLLLLQLLLILSLCLSFAFLALISDSKHKPISGYETCCAILRH